MAQRARERKSDAGGESRRQSLETCGQSVQQILTAMSMRSLVAARDLFSLPVSMICGLAVWQRVPFPDENNLLQLILLTRPYLFYVVKSAYFVMLFTTPYIGASFLFSLIYIFVPREPASRLAGKLPPYPEPAKRGKLFLVVGEVHHPRREEPAADPHWLVIPDRGLYTGTIIFG